MSLKTGLLVILVFGILVSGGVTYLLLNPTVRNASGPEDHPDKLVPDGAQIIPGNNSTIPGQPSGAKGNNTTAPAKSNSPIPSPANLAELINASNLFALEMYKELANPNDNLFFSPYSIFTALGMTYEGARGSTADEIRSVFHFPVANQTRWTLFKALIEKMNAGDSGCNLSTANAMWIQQDFNILSEYVDTVEGYYNAEASSVDYMNAAEEARQRINSWVEDQTDGKIHDLIPQGVLNGNTVLVLTNAIYFKGDWLRQFNISLTEEKNFYTDAGTTVNAQMMARRDNSSIFNYTETDGIQVLEMPYASEKLSMMVLLPKRGTTDSLEDILTPQKLDEWRGKLRGQRVDIFFPRFKLDTKYTLNDNLSNMGMPSAFSPAADFSGIDGIRDLYISRVIHQAHVSVNESGTEAAAATAVIVLRTGGPAEPRIPVFNADHPFIFIIQEKETGNILFMGKLLDPTK